jgi:hypothetical protein
MKSNNLKKVIHLKKTFAAVLATVAVLACASMPIMANAATVTQSTHANTLNTTAFTSSYSVNSILPAGTATNTWGTSSLTADDASQEFDWKVSPATTSKSYTYYMQIDYYTASMDHSYVGTVGVPTASGVGVLSGTVTYPQIYLGPGAYLSKLSGTWTASDGTSGSIGTASATIRYAI